MLKSSEFLQSTLKAESFSESENSKKAVSLSSPLAFSWPLRMESTEKCDVVIQHFNGKFLKTPPGVPGTTDS